MPAAIVAALLCGAPEAFALQVVVDVNSDGLLVTDPALGVPVDRPTTAEPFIFWVNHDQDDLEEGGESWPITRPDGDTPVIDSARDLEDFARLAVRWQNPPEAGARLEFRWRGAKAPVLNLYAAADPSCSRAYQLAPDAAAAQRSAPFGQRLGRLGKEPLRVRPRSCFLFDVATPGTAVLEVLLVHADGSVEAAPSVPVEFRHVKSLYQRWAADWPDDVGPPWTYVDEDPPVPVLEPYVDDQGYAFRPPWSESDDVIVWVYGWLRSAESLYEMATTQLGETVFKRLWHRGFRGRLVFYRWPTQKPRLSYGLLQSEYRAWKSAPALLRIVEGLPENRRVHVTAHSMGGIVLTEALRLGLLADTALLQVAAVPAGVFDAREQLLLPDMIDTPTPRRASAGGYEGYLTSSRTPIDVMVNYADVTFFGWNLAQKRFKPTAKRGGYRYFWKPDLPGGGRAVLRQGGRERIVQDPHEVLAFVARSRTHAVGAEKRVQGIIRDVYDLARPTYGFGAGHVVGWTRPVQETTRFYTLLLDIFGIAYVSEHL